MIIFALINLKNNYMNRTKAKFLIFNRRIKKYIKNIFTSSENVNSVQKQSYLIVKRMIAKEDSTLLIAPISNQCYVEWQNYFIKLSDNAVTITNGKFSYYVSLPFKHTGELKDFFNHTVEGRRQKMESNYENRTLSSLKEISKDLYEINKR